MFKKALEDEGGIDDGKFSFFDNADKDGTFKVGEKRKLDCQNGSTKMPANKKFK